MTGTTAAKRSAAAADVRPKTAKRPWTTGSHQRGWTTVSLWTISAQAEVVD